MRALSSSVTFRIHFTKPRKLLISPMFMAQQSLCSPQSCLDQGRWLISCVPENPLRSLRVHIFHFQCNACFIHSSKQVWHPLGPAPTLADHQCGPSGPSMTSAIMHCSAAESILKGRRLNWTCQNVSPVKDKNRDKKKIELQVTGTGLDVHYFS